MVLLLCLPSDFAKRSLWRIKLLSDWAERNSPYTLYMLVGTCCVLCVVNTCLYNYVHV